MFAPAHHAGDALRGPGAQAARGAHDLQLPRPADQPGRRHAPADRRRRTRRYLETIAGALARLGAAHALVVSSDDGLDELSHLRADARRRGADGDARAATRSTPEDVGLDARRSRTSSSGGTPEVNAEIARRILAGERGAAARRRGAQRRRGDLRRRPRGRRSRRACAPPRRRSTPARRRAVLERFVAFTAAGRDGGLVGMNTLERIVDVDPRARSSGAASAVPLATLERAARSRAARTARSREALARPGISRDRRAQAPLAVGRARSARARRVDGDRPRLRARRRGGAVDPHRGPALRRLARRPARGARGDATCRSCARTSSSTPTSSTSRRPPAPTRSC